MGFAKQGLEGEEIFRMLGFEIWALLYLPQFGEMK
jgi:hypothetical protein